MYKRKTRDRWDIVTDYGYGWEVETSEDTYKEALNRYKEYCSNTDARVMIVKHRERIVDVQKEIC